MNVVAFNGSARRGGNTAAMLKAAMAPLEAAGIETELVELGGRKMHGCIACYKCFENKDHRCAVNNDFMNECIDRMHDADGILLGSPTYYANISTEMKALIDRAGLVARANGNSLRRKVGAGVVVARRGGAVHAFNSLNHFFFINEMVVPGADYWNMGFGLEKGDVLKDEEAMNTMRILGENMAWVMEALHK
jgi:multimeric flavodoxin WrbA